MAKQAGIEVYNISGYAKGYGFKVGDIISGTNHEWNAIKYNGLFYLIDSTWGTGHAYNK